MGAEIFQCGNGQTDMPKPTVAFRNFANAPKIYVNSQHAMTPSAAPQMSDKRQLDQTIAHFTSVSMLLPESLCYGDNRRTPSTQPLRWPGRQQRATE